MSKVIVTGGAGFIGSHLVDTLKKEEHKVLVMDDLSGGTLRNLSFGTRFADVDCREDHLVDVQFNRFKPDVVYHLAANAAENKAQFSPVDVTSRNFGAFINVLTSFIRHKGKRFVFFSSIASYGALQTPFKETDRPEPEDLYGISKYSSEMVLHVMSKVYGFEYVIVRPHNVYGEKQNMKDPYRNVVSLWLRAVQTEEPINIYGDGEQKRQFTYINDLIEPLYVAGFGDVSGRTFNIGADRAYSLNELKDAIVEMTGYKNIKYLPGRAQEVKDAIADHTEAKKHLEYKDTTSLKEGIKKTYEWMSKRTIEPLEYTEIELESDKLPVNWRV